MELSALQYCISSGEPSRGVCLRRHRCDQRPPGPGRWRCRHCHRFPNIGDRAHQAARSRRPRGYLPVFPVSCGDRRQRPDHQHLQLDGRRRLRTILSHVATKGCPNRRLAVRVDPKGGHTDRHSQPAEDDGFQAWPGCSRCLAPPNGFRSGPEGCIHDQPSRVRATRTAQRSAVFTQRAPCQNRYFTDKPMHTDILHYSLEFCENKPVLSTVGDIVTRWSEDVNDLHLMLDHEDERWDTMNVLGQVVNVIRDAGTSKRHVRIPAIYKSGISLFVRTSNQVAYKELRSCPELPLMPAAAAAAGASVMSPQDPKPPTA